MTKYYKDTIELNSSKILPLNQVLSLVGLEPKYNDEVKISAKHINYFLDNMNKKFNTNYKMDVLNNRQHEWVWNNIKVEIVSITNSYTQCTVFLKIVL